MKISDMNQIMALAQASNETVHMVGRHGIGKSQAVEGYCKENNIHLETLMLSQQEVSDLVGIPVEKDGVTYWSKPSWLQRMTEAGERGQKCLLFLDELARSPLEVRQSALQIVLDRRIHEHHLPELNGIKTLVVAADNPADEYQTDELDPALLDRFLSLSVEVCPKGWLNWAKANNIDSVITDYVAEFPEKLHWMAEEGEFDKGSTPRAWAKTSDIIKNISMVPQAMTLPIFIGKLGEKVGNSFFLYYNDYTKVMKVEDLVEMIGKESIKTEKDQKKVAKIISEKTQALEAMSADQLALKIRKEIEENGMSFDIITVFFASLNLEVCASILKSWKETEDGKTFYYDLAGNIPDRWLFRHLVAEVQN